MFMIIGWVVVSASILGGFVLAGGHLAVLWQPVELLVIFGSAAGAFVAGTPKKNIGATIKGIKGALGSGVTHSKQNYLEVLSLLFELLNKAKRESLMAIEQDVEEPEKSAIFQKYPTVTKDHHLQDFITDYMRMMISGSLNPHEVADIMEAELEVHHAELHVPVSSVQKMADGLPAFGIVAAVLGVVHTMESVGQPPAVLGGMIAAALVGTFLGILVAYGFVSPIANRLEADMAPASKPFECVKTVLLASMSGYPPAMAVEFGRKVLFSAERPTFKELEEAMKAAKSK